MKRTEELLTGHIPERYQPLTQGLAEAGRPATQLGEPISRQTRDAQIPLSYAQQRLWFLQQLEPDSVAYNLHWAVQMDGPLDQPALAAALSHLLARHEALRTSFPTQAGQPQQLIHPPGSAP